jgi:hypothetical protein
MAYSPLYLLDVVTPLSGFTAQRALAQGGATGTVEQYPGMVQRPSALLLGVKGIGFRGRGLCRQSLGYKGG